MFCGHGLMKWMLIDVHKTVTNKQRINALKYDVNKIYILVLDIFTGILYHVAKKGSPLEGFYFYCSATLNRIRKKRRLLYGYVQN